MIRICTKKNCPSQYRITVKGDEQESHYHICGQCQRLLYIPYPESKSISNFKKLVIGVWAIAAILLAFVLYRQFFGQNTNETNEPIVQTIPTAEPIPSTNSGLRTISATCAVNLKKTKEIEPFLREQITSLLTKEGSMQEKQELLACINKYTTAANENQLVIDGHRYELHKYIAKNQAVVLESINIQWYRKNDSDSIKSCKITATATSKLLIVENNNVAVSTPVLVGIDTKTISAPKPVITAPSSNNQAIVTTTTLPRKFAGNIAEGGENDEIITIPQSSIIQNGNTIEFIFSIFGAAGSGKNLKGIINLADNTVELEKIGKGTISKQNDKTTLALSNNTIILHSK